jgi:hypothetical protein
MENVVLKFPTLSLFSGSRVTLEAYAFFISCNNKNNYEVRSKGRIE